MDWKKDLTPDQREALELTDSVPSEYWLCMAVVELTHTENRSYKYAKGHYARAQIYATLAVATRGRSRRTW